MLDENEELDANANETDDLENAFLAEFDDNAEDAEDAAADDNEAGKAKDDGPKGETWDKERQRADQAEANFRKEQDSRQELETKLNDQAEKTQAMQDKLEELAKVNDVDLTEIDEEMTDPVVVKALKAMQSKIDKANAKAESLEKVAEGYRQNEQAKETTAARSKAQDEIVADIEEEYPAKYRNEAVKAADAICKERGYSPRDRYEASKLLKSCYKALASKKKAPASDDEKIPTDSGKGSSSVAETKGKGGSIKDLANQWRKKLRT